jgi:hypothetical protein
MHLVSQDRFIELVSRLRFLILYANGCPWDSVHDASTWPLMLPNLEKLLWWGGDGWTRSPSRLCVARFMCHTRRH